METKFYRVEIYHCYEAGFSYKEELANTMVFTSPASAFRYISDMCNPTFYFIGIMFDYVERKFEVRFVP